MARAGVGTNGIGLVRVRAAALTLLPDDLREIVHLTANFAVERKH
jgi:hypothetical protein